MIVDAVLYSGETEMLELRARTLATVVDLFVVVMCTRTHQGELARVDYETDRLVMSWAYPNGWLGRPFSTHYVEVGPLPQGERGGVGSSHYQRIERAHRDGVRDACVAAGVPGDAIVMVSDVDEIPAAYCVDELDAMIDLMERHDGRHWLVLEQRFHSTALDLLHPQQPWLGTCVSRLTHCRPQEQRDARGDLERCESISEGGWHLSWFGTDMERQRKLDTFSHAELRGRFDPAEARIARTHANGEPLRQLSLAELQSLDWPAPLLDGTFVAPAHWWATPALVST